MIEIFNKKLGDKIPLKELGYMGKIFTGKVRLMKITYTAQDEAGVTMKLSTAHKDYVDEEEDKSEEEIEQEAEDKERIIKNG